MLPVPVTAPPSRARRLLVLALRGLLIAGGLVAMALCFFLFGEERDRQPLRPDLTARQRAQAFRHVR